MSMFKYNGFVSNISYQDAVDKYNKYHGFPTYQEMLERDIRIKKQAALEERQVIINDILDAFQDFYIDKINDGDKNDMFYKRNVVSIIQTINSINKCIKNRP